MKISFEADMLKRFLVEAGIDSNDAKAIVYDLMLLQDAPPKSVARVQPTSRPVNTRPQPETSQPQTERTVIHKPVSPVIDFNEEEEEQPEAASQPNRSKVRVQKRLSFENFGGAAKSLRE